MTWNYKRPQDLFNNHKKNRNNNACKNVMSKIKKYEINRQEINTFYREGTLNIPFVK